MKKRVEKVKLNKLDENNITFGIDSKGYVVFAAYEGGLREDNRGRINSPSVEVQNLAEMSGAELVTVSRDISRYCGTPAYVTYAGKILGSFYRIRSGRSEDRFFLPLIIGAERTYSICCRTSGRRYILPCPYICEDKAIVLNPLEEVDLGQDGFCYLDI